MTDPRTTPRERWLIRLAVLAGWVLFTLMVIAITWAGNALRGRPLDLGNTLIWNLGWIMWAGMTFVVAALARRFPLDRPHLARGVTLHVALGLAVSSVVLAAEFLLNAAFGKLWPADFRPNALVGFFAYKFHIYFLIYWMVLGATRAFDFYARFRQSELLASQLETKLAHAQLAALKTQLQPHFLFNTHHSIVSLMLKNETPAAIRMLTRLSDLLRVTLEKTDRPVVSLQEELDALELYLGIQRERYGERLTVRCDIDPTIANTEVPCLLLQPLVENALQHGIEPLTEGGQLHVTARREGEQLVLTVADNGPGLAVDFKFETSEGIGLRNTQARLERLYGKDQRFEIKRRVAGGTEVTIELPFRTAAPAQSLRHE